MMDDVVNATFLGNATNDITASCGFGADAPCETEGSDLSTNAFWITLWCLSLFIFLCLPCCITQSRRELCWRRLKERRWISDDREDDWYTAAIRRQQEQRRQQLDEQQRRFRTTRTQEDEIREQFLLQCMENYTMVRFLFPWSDGCAYSHVSA